MPVALDASASEMLFVCCVPLCRLRVDVISVSAFGRKGRNVRRLRRALPPTTNASVSPVFGLGLRTFAVCFPLYDA